LKNLKCLVLGYDGLESLDKDAFSGLVKLKYVDLGKNKLKYLHQDTFIGLPNTQNIYVDSSCGLHAPTDRPFINSHSLSHRGISSCNVHSVSVETFTNVSTLERLDLKYNNLGPADINILIALSKLSKIYVYGNRQQCNCQLQKVWRWCEDRNIETAVRE